MTSPPDNRQKAWIQSGSRGARLEFDSRALSLCATSAKLATPFLQSIFRRLRKVNLPNPRGRNRRALSAGARWRGGRRCLRSGSYESDPGQHRTGDYNGCALQNLDLRLQHGLSSFRERLIMGRCSDDLFKSAETLGRRLRQPAGGSEPSFRDLPRYRRQSIRRSAARSD
jgi:hypothetical protein